MRGEEHGEHRQEGRRRTVDDDRDRPVGIGTDLGESCPEAAQLVVELAIILVPVADAQRGSVGVDGDSRGEPIAKALSVLHRTR